MKLVEQCLMEHEDSAPWGYRALVPGAIVVDHTPQPTSEENALQLILWESPTKSDSEEVVAAVPAMLIDLQLMCSMKMTRIRKTSGNQNFSSCRAC